MKSLNAFFLIVDVGFVLYWGAAIFDVLPADYLFKDYHDPILKAWNFSFLPLDLLVSATGLISIVLRARGHPRWVQLASVSLVLTFCSGLQAITFWALRHDFEMLWWAPNLFLMIYPLFFLPSLTEAIQGNQPR